MNQRRPSISRVTSALLLLSAWLPAAPGQDCAIQFVGGDLGGASDNGGLSPSVSADGRRVAYLQNTFLYHAFVHDRATGEKESVDALDDGTPMNGATSVVVLSANGRRAAFMSSASNAGALGLQVYVKDLDSGGLEIATVTPSGTPMTPTGTTPGMGSASFSADGARVVFTSDSQELVAGKSSFWRDVFVRDVAAGTTTRLLGLGGAEPNLPALFEPAISADGRWVAFASRASNLVAGDTNAHDDVFVHDLESGTTERVSVGWNGSQSNHDSEDPVTSADGRFVAFVSRASNLAQGDTNGVRDVFVYDRVAGVTERANLGPGGSQANGPTQNPPRIAAGGRHVLFHSVATNLVAPPVSGGRLYLRDLDGHVTALIVDPAASPGENDVAALSTDALTVAFASTMLFGAGDLNAFFDVFVRACGTPRTVSYCPTTPTSLGCLETIDWSGGPSASAGSGFFLSTNGSPSQQTGVLIYSTTSAGLLPIGGSFLCILPPVQRAGVLDSGGNPPPEDCLGSFVLDFNAWIAGGKDPSLIEGTPVWAQFWSRDPGSAGFGHLTHAVAFTIGP